MGEIIQSVGQIFGWALLSLIPIGVLAVGISVIAKSFSDKKTICISIFALVAMVMICLCATSIKIYQLGLSASDRAYLDGYDKGQKDFLEGK